MSAPVLVGEAARARAAELRAQLGGARDPLRVVWDEQATDRDRRLLLAMAGHGGRGVGLLAAGAWCDLRPEVRAAVADGLRRWRAWAERLA